MRPQKNRGGTLISLDSFEVSNIQRTEPSYGVLTLDVSKINTLTVGSVVVTNSPSVAYARCRDGVTFTTIKDLIATNDPQTIDVSNYNTVQLAVVINSSGANYGSVRMNNITGK